jgi:FkbM family methyltransferase
VGAHHGESALFFRRLFPHSTIYSFEPDPDSFAILSSLGLSNHIFVNDALSDVSGPASFFRNSISHTNSLFPVNYKSIDSISLSQSRSGAAPLDDTNYNNPVTITASTLDDAVAAFGVDHIALLKIDVQGAESMVLKGSSNTLESIDAILVEVALFDYYDCCSSFYSIEQLLSPHGFSLFAITDMSQNPMNGRTDWVEALYRRTLF